MVHSISLDTAKQILDVAEDVATSIDVSMSVTVVNIEGNRIAVRRMDGASYPSVEISEGKAFTAACLQTRTEELGKVTDASQPAHGLDIGGTQIVTWGGGIPLVEDGVCVGGLGVSGGSGDEDIEVAEAGLAKFEELIR